MKTSFTIITILFILLYTPVASQKSILQADTGAIDLLNRKAWDIRNHNLEKSKADAMQAIQLAEKSNYVRGLSYSYNVLGHYHKVKGNYDSAEYYYRKSLDIRQKLKEITSTASSYRNIISIYKLRGNMTKALETGQTAIQLLHSKPGDPEAEKEKARIQNNMAAIYMKSGDYSNAIKYAHDAQSAFQKYPDEEGLASVTFNLGNIYEEHKEYTKAIAQLNEAAKLYDQLNNQRELAKVFNSLGNVYYNMEQYGVALKNYKQSIEIRNRNGYEDDIKGSLFNIGVIYETLSTPDSAFHYYTLSLKQSERSGNTEGLYEGYRAIGGLMSDQGKHNIAIPYLHKALWLTQKTGALPERLITLGEIGKAFKRSGNKDSALFYTDQYLALNDSLHESLRSAIELESTIKEQDYKLKISYEKNRSQKYIIAGMSLAIILLLIIFFLIYKSARAKRNMRQLKYALKEQELQSLDAMLEGQEKERKRLSLELHDTIGSILAATKYAFKSMENSLERIVSENKHQYTKINGMLDEAMDSVRRISHDMATGILTEQGIEGALKQLCERFELSGRITITLNTYGLDEKVDSAIELNIYRVIQELLTNIIKHAQAQKVVIQLTKSHKNINLMVEDDGKGFDVKDTAGKGIGLSNINNRVQKLNGSWNIDSVKGKGTTIIIDIPINTEHT